MKSQLYLWDKLRQLKKEEILLFKNTFKERVFPVFKNVEQEAEKLSNDIYNDFMNRTCSEYDIIDPYDIAEHATEIGIDYYEKYSLMRYNTLAMWISMLYQFWEQQVRKFLYDEERNYFSIDFKRFCSSGINDIKEEFNYHNTNIEKLQCWHSIKELRLICNTLKHGDGGSAQELKKIRPDFFTREGLEEYDLLSMYNTTLLEEVLNIKEEDFYNFCDILTSFWDELPECMYSNEIKD
ncbi:hypothetical protein [Clostridium aciditolerans]|uniref:Uncharacterized protein n=1 Tax=Clostridium aciditolerans TaxID=339861 RepID=A0A934HUA5_9CLOT|nr:hypothetical protein [Clostridium aciditolerans]MBI6873438.1 hypothetical protein [Clostridium aciditolerans]